MKTEQPSTRFLLCPRCGRKTRTQVRADTELIRFPLFCPKCRFACVVTYKGGMLEMTGEPDASE